MKKHNEKQFGNDQTVLKSGDLSSKAYSLYSYSDFAIYEKETDSGIVYRIEENSEEIADNLSIVELNETLDNLFNEITGFTETDSKLVANLYDFLEMPFESCVNHVGEYLTCNPGNDGKMYWWYYDNNCEAAICVDDGRIIEGDQIEEILQ